MKIIPLSELRTLEFQAKRIFSMLQYWDNGESFSALNSPKKTHSFLCFAGCDGRYTFPDGKQLPVSRGDVVFIPAGSRYQIEFFNKRDPISTILINFELEADGEAFALSDTVIRLTKDPNKVFNKLFYQSAHECACANASVISMKRSFYQILQELEKAHKFQIDQGADYAKIAKGISHLENDSDQQLTIGQLAEMCGVSTNTFRRLFHSYAGVSPMEFRLRDKISRAKQLLDSEIFTVSETGDMLGFADVAYFSRIFKIKTGMSPMEYIRSRKERE